MKYNVGGTMLSCIFRDGIEASSKEEAVEKFKEIVQKSIEGVDWIEWRDVEAEEVKDYTTKINKALADCGYGSPYMVDSTPKLVCSGKATTPKVFNNIDVYKAEVRCGGVLYFIVIGTEIYLPVTQDHFCMPTSDFWEKDLGMNNVLKVFWMSKNNIYTFNNSGDLISLYIASKNYGMSTLGARIMNILTKLPDYWKIGYFLMRSESRYLEMKSCDGRHTLKATFSSCEDEYPDTFMQISKIIP